MRLVAGLTLVAMLSACAPAEPFKVVDGERVMVRGHHLRLHGVDAPDATQPACPAEAEAAARTEMRLRQVLSNANVIDFQKTGMACLQWASCDAFVKADGVDVSELLISQGFAAKRTVEGGGVAPRDWCAEPAEIVTGAAPAP